MSEDIQVVCPECEELNLDEFIFESETIEQLGFISSEDKTDAEEWAGNGLCRNLTCIREWCKKRNLDSRFKMGVPLIPTPKHDGLVEAKYETVYKCEECNIGEYTYNSHNLTKPIFPAAKKSKCKIGKRGISYVSEEEFILV